MTASTTVTPFTYHDHTVRTLMEDGEPLFVLTDLCKVLSIRNARNVASRLDDDEKGVRQADTLRGRQRLTVVTEAGMYEVILRSDKPEARAFRRWVTHEVLPQLRRTGAYQTTSPTPAGEDQARSEQVEVPRPSTYLPTTWDLLIVTGTDTQGRRFTDEIMYRTPDGTGYASVRSRGGRPAHTVTWVHGHVDRYWAATAVRDALVGAAHHMLASTSASTRERGCVAVLEEMVRTSVVPPWREPAAA